MKKEIEMKFEKAVKNTYKYLEITNTTPTLGTLYIERSFFNGSQPKMMKITIEWKETNTFLWDKKSKEHLSTRR